MTPGLFARLDQGVRNLLPLAVTVSSMLFAMASVPLPGWSVIAPPLALLSIFYWSIHRPDLLRPSAVFLVGILQDLMGGTPVGLASMSFMLCYWLMLTQRRFFLGSTFLVLWVGFGVVAVLNGAVQWLTFSIVQATLARPGPVVVQCLLAILLFPLPTTLFQRLHRAYLS